MLAFKHGAKIHKCLNVATRPSTFRDFQPVSRPSVSKFSIPNGHAQILPAKAYRGGVEGEKGSAYWLQDTGNG